MAFAKLAAQIPFSQCKAKNAFVKLDFSVLPENAEHVMLELDMMEMIASAVGDTMVTEINVINVTHLAILAQVLKLTNVLHAQMFLWCYKMVFAQETPHAILDFSLIQPTLNLAKNVQTIALSVTTFLNVKIAQLDINKKNMTLLDKRLLLALKFVVMELDTKLNVMMEIL